MRKWKENDISSFSLHFLSISSFSLHFLFISSFSLHFLAAGLQCCNDSRSPGLQYSKNSQIFLCVFPQSSFGHALRKGDKNWISRCLSWRFCFGCTPVHSQSAELQPFYGRLRFATLPPICHFRCFWSQDAMDLFNFSTVFLIFPKWQMGGVCLF